MKKILVVEDDPSMRWLLKKPPAQQIRGYDEEQWYRGLFVALRKKHSRSYYFRISNAFFLNLVANKRAIKDTGWMHRHHAVEKRVAGERILSATAN